MRATLPCSGVGTPQCWRRSALQALQTATVLQVARLPAVAPAAASRRRAAFSLHTQRRTGSPATATSSSSSSSGSEGLLGPLSPLAGSPRRAMPTSMRWGPAPACRRCRVCRSASSLSTGGSGGSAGGSSGGGDGGGSGGGAAGAAASAALAVAPPPGGQEDVILLDVTGERASCCLYRELCFARRSDGHYRLGAGGAVAGAGSSTATNSWHAMLPFPALQACAAPAA